jgi:2-C-methyl-D-erythritol 4-phosphate cytidylyltransferase
VAVALVLAAGLGERLGLGRPKALAELAGRPLWQWSVDVLREAQGIERIVLAMPAAQLDATRTGLAQMVYANAELPQGRSIETSPVPSVTAVAGGAVRSESVRLALDAAGEDIKDGLVLVHDAARPLLTREIVGATLAAAGDGVDAAIAATPVVDTIKQVDGDGRVLRTLDRSELWAVQTPQVFRRDALERALDVSAEVLAEATDDAWLIERTGGCVVIVPAPRENLKVTMPLDLQLAELLLARRELTPEDLSASA